MSALSDTRDGGSSVASPAASTHGIYFANLLTQQPQQDRVPSFLLAFMRAFYSQNAHLVPGVFREGGSWQRVQEIVDRCEKDPEDLSFLCQESVHDLTSLLKRWIIELPVPLIPRHKYAYVLKAQEVEDFDMRVSEYALQMSSLNPTHRATLRHILFMFVVVVKNSQVNRMELRNVVQVLIPTIMRTESDYDMVRFFGAAGASLAFLISNYNEIFGHYDPYPFMSHLNLDDL
eukprot:c20078_g1_i5.p1 GENE.c20078_g1_i5~~c20078_g1_i5.p1  ORF type:complete len:232 (+),score=53.72 c20078_g1_i5:689-1384(+)